MTQNLIIRGRLPGYNELTSGHWATRYKAKREGIVIIMLEAIAKNIKRVDGFAVIEIRCYEPNAKRDNDNVSAGAAKIILDALQQYGAIKGDGQKYVRCIQHPPEVDRQNPRIEVTITEVLS